MATLTYREILRKQMQNANQHSKNSQFFPLYHTYHFDSPGHDTDDCWTLKNKIQDLIDAKEIEFDPPETPNVITAPMPNH